MPKCLKCNEDFPNWIKINGELKLLASRKYCLKCSPYGKHNTIQKHLKDDLKKENKKCLKCNEINNENFYEKSHSYCKKCWNILATQKQRKNKEKGNEYLGNKCSKCGYDKCSGALHWHHKNPENKDKEFNRKLNWSWNRLKIELDKCILLCSNCHIEEHENHFNTNNI